MDRVANTRRTRQQKTGASLSVVRGGAQASTRAQAGSPAGRDVHRVKITLSGAKPPIWRRLEVLSDITLHRLHEVIQQSFGWDGGHMWVFSTPDGQYGVADPELDFRSAAARKLSDAPPGRAYPLYL
jgi:hypothetical protein